MGTITVLLLALIGTSVSLHKAQQKVAEHEAAADGTPRNVIFFVTDGMGPAQLTLGRTIKAYRSGEETDLLEADDMLVGSSRTRSANSLVTDSAAGATAFTTGFKTDNMKVSVSELNEPLGTVLEASKLNGKATGMVVTKSITDATPAAFSSHVVYRELQDLIAEQQVGHNIDVLMGGGLQFYKYRADGRNLLAEMADDGYTVAETPAEMAAADRAPFVGLFANGSLAYDVDREADKQPSLAEMTEKALGMLKDAGGDAGFFLLVEASQIDVASHHNDAVGVVSEMMAWDDAMRIAKTFADVHGETLIVSVSDHETGGLTLGGTALLAPGEGKLSRFGGLQGGDPTKAEAPQNANLDLSEVVYQMPYDNVSPYFFVPSVLSNPTHSGVYASKTIGRLVDASQGAVDYAAVFADQLHIDDLSVAERRLMDAAVEQRRTLTALKANGTATVAQEHYGYPIEAAINRIVNKRSNVDFTSKAHTGVDVNLYARGPGASKFRGCRENTDLTKALVDLLQLNMDLATSLVKDVDVGECTDDCPPMTRRA